MFTATVSCVPVDPVKVKDDEGHVVEELSAMQTAPVIAACAVGAFGVSNKTARKISGTDDANLCFFIRTHHYFRNRRNATWTHVLIYAYRTMAVFEPPSVVLIRPECLKS